MTRALPPEFAGIAEAVFEADLAALRRHKARVTAIAAEIADLQSRPSAAEARSITLGDVAGAVQYVLWISWRDRRLLALQAQLAKERAAREEILARTRRSFGRKTAIEVLIARQKAGEARRLRR